MRHTRLVNYALYQIGWFACVVGASVQHPWAGLSIAVALTAAHVIWSEEPAIEASLVLLAAAVGTALESIQIAAGTYTFSSGLVLGALPPPWLVMMWGQFATTFRFSLRPVIASPMRAALFGAVGGPAAFLAGQRLGAVTFLPPVVNGLLRLAVCWSLAMATFAVIVRRLTPDGREPR
jgi:hypothetical protein